tara:strand:- start:184 stop:648 length:465 start_codon:yes stop_codon:yes gene_type:complete
MKNSSKNVGNSKELNIPQMIQFNEDSISIFIRYFVKCNDYTDLITYLMQIMNQFVVKKRTQNLGTFVKLIIDFDSINMSSIDFEFVKTLINYLDTNYDEVLANIYCINVSFFFKMVYKILKPVLTKKVKEKIIFIKKGQTKELRNLTDADFDDL